MQNQNGTTVVELLTVVLILGILVGIALPSAQNLGTWPLKTAAQELAGAMREARETAIAHGQTCTLVFYEINGRYRIDLPSGSTTTTLTNGVSIMAVNFPLVNSRPTLYFRFTGAPNRGGHVTLKDEKGNRLYVIVTPVTGRVRVDVNPP